MPFRMARKARSVSFIVVGMMGLTTLTSACSPHLFEPQMQEQSSTGGTNGPPGGFAKPKSPYSLMTSFQLFSSMLNVTGQNGAATANQRAEYSARTGALSDNDSLTTINAPLSLAATSLGGEVCSGLIAKETPIAQANRRFFAAVNFGQTLAQNGSAAFNSAVGVMATAFWGRTATADELAALQGYYSDFESSYGSAGATSTRKLYLSVCAAMLSSFDSMIN